MQEIEVVEKKVKEEQDRQNRLRQDMQNMSEEDRLKAEDEEYRRRRKTAVDAIMKEMLQKIFAATFGKIEDRAWGQIQKRWEKFAGK